MSGISVKYFTLFETFFDAFISFKNILKFAFAENFKL